MRSTLCPKFGTSWSEFGERWLVDNTFSYPEAVSPETWGVVEQGDVAGMAEAIKDACGEDRERYSAACRKRAEEHFDKDKCF